MKPDSIQDCPDSRQIGPDPGSPRAVRQPSRPVLVNHPAGDEDSPTTNGHAADKAELAQRAEANTQWHRDYDEALRTGRTVESIARERALSDAPEVSDADASIERARQALAQAEQRRRTLLAKMDVLAGKRIVIGKLQTELHMLEDKLTSVSVPFTHTTAESVATMWLRTRSAVNPHPHDQWAAAVQSEAEGVLIRETLPLAIEARRRQLASLIADAAAFAKSNGLPFQS
jgi:hypothetical protein